MPSGSTPPSSMPPSSSMWERASASSEATEHDAPPGGGPDLDFTPMHPSQASMFRRLVGTWSLERATSSSAHHAAPAQPQSRDGGPSSCPSCRSGSAPCGPALAPPTSSPLGPHPRGLLIYSPDGYVTVSIEGGCRPVLYTGPFELASAPKHRARRGAWSPHTGASKAAKDEDEDEDEDETNCALCYDMLESSLHPAGVGAILPRELRLIGSGPHRLLAMHMPGMAPDELSLDLLWRRQEVFSF